MLDRPRSIFLRRTGRRAYAPRLKPSRRNGGKPTENRIAQARDGAISATASPIAVQAGLHALRQGGSAADAAATIALTQVATQLGSMASYAGIMTLLYYEANSGKVHSMDAGYNSYKGETDPRSIPVCDLAPLNFGLTPGPRGDEGRQTLVPGFMAGIEALHGRFGRLPFATLFEPAIWYAEHGVTISPILARFFEQRENVLSRTPQGLRFMRQAGNDRPMPGDRFVQSDLAATLGAVAKQGAAALYEGAWAEAFVEAVRAAGGKATLDDLRDYRARWSDPHVGDAFGHTVYLNGPPNLSVDQVMTGLHVAEARALDRRGPCWSDPATFYDLARIGAVVCAAPYFSSVAIELLLEKGVDVSFPARRAKPFGEALASILDRLTPPPPSNAPRHSDSIVVVDKDGDIAVMTHTINTVLWGGSGLVVGGIPLPDSAGFQQARLAQLTPGERLPNEVACTLTFAADKPVLAMAPIGSSLLPETLKTIVSVIGQKQDLSDVAAAPPLLQNFEPAALAKSMWERPVSVAGRRLRGRVSGGRQGAGRRGH